MKFIFIGMNAMRNFKGEGDILYLLTSKEAFDFLSSEDGSKYITSIIRISADGIFRTLVEAAQPNDLGFDIIGDSDLSDEEFLKGNTRYVAIVSVTEKQEDDFVNFLFDHDIELVLLGNVTGGEIVMDDRDLGFIDDYVE